MNTRGSASSSGNYMGKELLLDGLHISESDEGRTKRLTKRQISRGTYEANTPADPKQAKHAADETASIGLQRVHFVGARKPGVVPKMWSNEEDEALRAAVRKYGDKNNWRRVAEDIPGRNHLQCLQRWKKALRPGLVKGQWKKEEDEKLLLLINTYLERGTIGNINWSSISNDIEGRNAKQCRERWFLNLDPSINHGPWTSEEDRQLVELAAQCGGRWALIAKNMDGRTENAVKTRYHTIMKQQARIRGWTHDEDGRLIKFALTFGRDWGKIVKQIPARSKGQLKKRFQTLTQSDPNLALQVQDIERRIASGEIDPPNPPPAPIEPIDPSQIGGQTRPAHSSLMHPSATQQQQQRPPGPDLGAFNPAWGLGDGGDVDFLASMPGPQLSSMVAPPPAAPFPETEKKGLSKRYGSSWMAGIVDNLDPPSEPPQDGIKRTDSQQVLSDIISPEGLRAYANAPMRPAPTPLESKQLAQRHETSNMAFVDQLLREGNPPTATATGPVPGSNGWADFNRVAAEAKPPAKGLREYNSWGSLGDNGVASLFQTGSNFGADTGGAQDAPAYQAAPLGRNGSKTFRKVPSSGFGTLGTYDSTSHVLNML